MGVAVRYVSNVNTQALRSAHTLAAVRCSIVRSNPVPHFFEGNVRATVQHDGSQDVKDRQRLR